MNKKINKYYILNNLLLTKDYVLKILYIKYKYYSTSKKLLQVCKF